MWFVYIIRSLKDNSLYTGITNNFERRLKEHNFSSRGAKYTKSRRPFVLFKLFTCTNRSQALQLECKIKKLSHKEKLEFQIDEIK